MRVKNEIFTACITDVFTPTFLTQLKNGKMERELFSSVENMTRNLKKRDVDKTGIEGTSVHTI